MAHPLPLKAILILMVVLTVAGAILGVLVAAGFSTEEPAHTCAIAVGGGANATVLKLQE